MSTPTSVKNQLRLLISNANNVTGKQDKDLSTAQASLISGYGQGGDDTDIVLKEIKITENGTYVPDSTCDGFNKVLVSVNQSGGTDGVLTPTDVSTLSLYNRGKTIELSVGYCLVSAEYIYGIYTTL